ncbi:hypothetical protein MASSI9I_90068 [Massilia sp. 9I]|nr:hypothetical protein MASSI9I_90068 [Massilia sp. 9I]
MPKVGACAAGFVIRLPIRSTVKNVRSQHRISLCEMTYRNLKKPNATDRIEGFISRHLKFHHIAASHDWYRVGRKS